MQAKPTVNKTVTGMISGATTQGVGLLGFVITRAVRNSGAAGGGHGIRAETRAGWSLSFRTGAGPFSFCEKQPHAK
jgi:hypothetical protein